MDKETQPSRRPHGLVFRHYMAGAILTAVLVWGSGFLLFGLSHFNLTYNIANKDLSILINSPPLLSHYAYPTNHSGLINGKIPLNFFIAGEGTFSPEYFEVQWIREPDSLKNDKGTYVVREHIPSGTDDEYDTQYVVKSIVDPDYEYVLFNGSAFKFAGLEYNIDKLLASPDLQLAVLRTNSTHNYRHSTFAIYWILDIHKNTIVPLFNPDDKISVTAWSPDSEKIAYVYDNNIYIKFITGSTEQITFDGTAEVFNGRPDWVYEEEVYASDITMWWSPNGDKLGYLRMDNSDTPTFPIPYYVQEGYEDYPKMVELKYPKPGYPNPKVDVGIYDLNTNDARLLKLDTPNIKDKLVTQVTWVSAQDVLVRISTRSSDLLEFYLINADTYKYDLVRTHSATHGWFEVTFDTFYVPKNEALELTEDGYIDTVVVDGYNHLAYFSPPSNSEGMLLTQGQWEIQDGSISFDYSDGNVYFISTMKSPVERHVHSVNLLEAIKSPDLPIIKNITDTSKEGFFSGSFSSGSRYLVLTYRGPSVPYQQLVDLKTNEVVRTLESNTKLAEALEKYAIPEVKHAVVSLGPDESGDEIFVDTLETFPLNFNPKMKYPVLFYVYGGPGSQTVTKAFSVGFSSIAAAELNAVVVTVDGRGTGFNTHNKNGADFKFIVRDLLGHYEPIDQIKAAKKWSEKPYVDSDRIAIWGWSYGGFMTLKTLETDTEHVFKYGCSVAPVTDWKLYDSVYTERYMRTPQENPEGYVVGSINNVTNFHNVTRFLMMHGSGDDNVHFQHSLKLLDKLNLESVENFDFMVFPDSDHSISYHNGNHVIYHRLLKWLKKAFNNQYVGAGH
ncbi:hypothetical protein PSN45_002042 [Yamadazyma tenuis]|uniref:Dipeptidyl aminopeptidase B n=1 Tax=Candida tenuis (strain ATCC 10573 / BCRC 21748 / CBS 615 / JCM 9827 / NBRC 10315 / NRRL Y-1498 / VKM Y-70) TaxID=590646 RepID=G3BCU1_CANTC|nr:uncharacterized protein CANTEDRAFT_110570 [Yamadazyma tenuis ATCC 10573]EGV60210.1 hypothetical protein CANTEDRAFT_110570 [Yamadazyma tenuis ATCC 10573]WEJ94551.1 hypothetical protein PSN45_002042 [Yamadazyma tenuis]